jgi:hypothetical protein
MLHRALGTYLENVRLLSQLMWLESKYRIENRLKR